jgi:uncharacterized protein (DUF1800 family)
VGLRDDPRRRVAHLLRRAGFGAGPAELDDQVALGYDGAVERLVECERLPDTLGPIVAGYDLDGEVRMPNLQRAWLEQMIATPRPLQEKMVLFFHGLLTSGAPKVRAHAWLWRQNQLFRRLALGSYRQLLKEIGRDPAMLDWLDGMRSRKAHPNENYARELMELFALGIGNYSENDVQEAARAFTGWTVEPATGTVAFRRAQHDAGPKTIFGQTASFDDQAVVDLVLGQEASRRFVARKLLTFFLTDQPDPALVDAYAERLGRSDFELRPVVKALLSSDEFSSDAVYRAKVKSPTEYAVGLLKQLGLARPGDGVSLAMHRMGQDLFAPPNVAGWPGGRAWVSTSMLLARFNGARGAIGRADLGPLAGGTPDQAATRLVAHFLDGEAPARLRAVVRDWLAARGTGPPGLRGAVHLIVSSPTYQLS